jgi:hypothetical protein
MLINCVEAYTLLRETEALVVARKEIGLKVTAGKTKYMVTSRDQNAGRNHNIKLKTFPLKVWNISGIWEQT